MLLDVPIEELHRESNVMELEKRLGPQGWNTDGRIYSATRSRAIYIMNFLRDEILEESLSAHRPKDFNARINDLRYRLDRSMAQLPSVFHSRFDKAMMAENPNNHIFMLAQVQVCCNPHDRL